MVYEDRPANFIGAMLAVASLRRWSSASQIVAWLPGAEESVESLLDGLGVELIRERSGLSGLGWNVKPEVLLRLLDRDAQVLWVDSDVLISGDLLGRLQGIRDDVLVATEEYYWGHYQGDTRRTTGLGLVPARTFSSTVNTGIVRVCRCHTPLLEAWRDVLSSEDYRAVQHLPAARRPVHFWGDQEALTGLLGSRDWSDVPVYQLRRGREIAQCYGASGFTAAERLAARRHPPLAVHAMGDKPWAVMAAARDKRLRDRYNRLVAATSPYALLVTKEYWEWPPDLDMTWTRKSSLLARTLTSVFGQDPFLAGLLPSLVEGTAKRARAQLGLGRIGAEAG